MNLLKDKTILITGASRGIGLGILELFVQNKAKNILFTHISSLEIANSIEEKYSNDTTLVKGYKSDASDFNATKKLIEDIMVEFNSIDVLVNNAGITKDNLVLRMTDEDFQKVMKVNMNSVFNFTKNVIPIM